MKLFDTIEAVKFPEENMIFITRGGYLYYIYNPKSKWWRKHSNAGNDHLTVSNYPDVSREELVNAMKGVFPKKETDFMQKPSKKQTLRMLILLYGGLTLRILRKVADRLYAKLSANEKL